MTKSNAALVLAAHGSRRNPAACTVIRAHAETIRALNRFSEVKTAFWHGEPPLAQVLSTITADEAYVVPVFKSEGYFTTVILPREMGLVGRVTVRPDRPNRVHLCHPVGSHPGMPELVHNLANSTADTFQFVDKETDLLVIGHGGKASKGSERTTTRMAEMLRERESFRSVTALFLEQPPEIEKWREVIGGTAVVAVPFLIGGGAHGGEIPVRLGLPPHTTNGRIGGIRVAVSVSVGELPDIARFIVDQVESDEP